MVENEPQLFENESTTYLYHANTDDTTYTILHTIIMRLVTFHASYDFLRHVF